MSFRARTTLLALLAAMGLALLVPVGAGAAEFPGIEKFAAINCKAEFENCAHKLVPKTIPYPVYAAILGPQTYSVTEEPKSLEESQEQGFTTAAGHVPFGVTDFKVATIGTKGEPGGELPQQIPTELVTHIRTDVAAGLATSPTAMPLCSGQSFGEKETPGSFGIEEIPGSGLFTAPKCVKASEVGVNEATVYVEAPKVSPPEEPGVAKFDLALSGKVYNLDPPKGRASLFGVALKLPIALTKGKLEKAFAELGNPFGPELETKWETEQWYAHTLIEGNVEWGKEAAGTEAGDYHDYFEINVSPELPLISSRLVFFGNREGEEGQTGDFITNATRCPGHETTTLKITDKEGVTVPRPYTNPFVHLSECEKVPFEPLFTLSPATTAHDTPDGFSTTLALTRHPKAAEQDSSELDNAEFTLPEGMTLNPSAAAGLTACTPAQARIHSPVPGVACPASSEVGTVTLNVPTLPPGSLVGKLYLGGPESGPITAPPYTMYLDAESERYGVSVRLEGKVIPNPVTGRITTVFTENPEQPFTNVTFHFKEGALAPVANPLVCGSAQVTTALTPYSGTGTVTPLSNPFTFDLNGAGGACASPPPFTPSQSTSETPTTGGSHSSFTFNLERGDGNQYFSEVKTTLPEGLVGAIPAATQCGEPGASKGECPSTSQIGEATVLAGAGPTPYAFKGPVYLTGPYNGAPFGMSIPVPAVAGPFNLGTIVTRATINVDQSTARVIVGSVLPRIVGGVPVRLKKITVQITKSGFLSNPTN